MIYFIIRKNRDTKDAETMEKTVTKGVLFRSIRTPSREQKKPKNTSKAIIRQLHDDMGQQGIVRMTQLARERYHWLDMTADILAYCKHCHCCNTAKAQIPADHAP